VAGQCPDLDVVVVNGLTTGLDVQPIGEWQMQSVHSPTHSIAGLENDHLPTSGTKHQRSGQPRKPSTHYDDAPFRRVFGAWCGGVSTEEGCPRRDASSTQ
jgi:hypothetical protein